MAPDEAVRDPALENVVFFASRAEIGAGAPSTWREAARHVLGPMAKQEIAEGAMDGGLVLTDDYNPIDFLNAPTARVWRARILEAS